MTREDFVTHRSARQNEWARIGALVARENPPGFSLTQRRPLVPCDQPLEARVPTQRREVRIDPEPRRREVVGDL